MFREDFSVDKNSIELTIREIEKCLDNGSYLSALFLSLALPDILGAIAYRIKKSKPRYIKWVNENYYDEFNRLPKDIWPGSPTPVINGNLLYELRSQMFHEGKNKILKGAKINRFVIKLSPLSSGVRGRSGSIMDESNNKIYQFLEINASELAQNMINSVKLFIDNNKDLIYPTIRVV